jgi:hypothetical protein
VELIISYCIVNLYRLGCVMKRDQVKRLLIDFKTKED